MSFLFDEVGNLKERRDHNQLDPSSNPLTEKFNYDSLNRLDDSQVFNRSDGTNGTLVDYNYTSIGNLEFKTGVGTYEYLNGKPHAVSSTNNGGQVTLYGYDSNGNMVASGPTMGSPERGILYNAFNKPIYISDGANSKSSTFDYGADRARVMQEDDTSRKIHYVGSLYEKEISPDGSTFTHKHYLQANGSTVAIYKSTETGGVTTPEGTFYLHRDHLDSVVVITDDALGEEKLSYDPHGRRRDNTDWVDYPASVTSPTATQRGFTGHEHLDNVGLIHMNGRVQDPLLGRFLSADPFVQFPENLQSFNRYTYVNNNPLSFTDPSGFTIQSNIYGAIFTQKIHNKGARGGFDLGNEFFFEDSFFGGGDSFGDFNLNFQAVENFFTTIQKVTFSLVAVTSPLEVQGNQFGFPIGQGVGSFDQNFNSQEWEDFTKEQGENQIDYDKIFSKNTTFLEDTANFLYGAASYPRGIFRHGLNTARHLGAFGEADRLAAENEAQIFNDAVNQFVNDENVRSETIDALGAYVSNNRAFVAGRFSTQFGFNAFLAKKFGLIRGVPLGLSLFLSTYYGDARDAVAKGHHDPQSIINSLVTGEVK